MIARSIKFSTLPTAYTVAILVWFLLWLTTGDGFWWMALLNRGVPYLFLPTPVLLLWGILIRKYKETLPLVLPLLFFGMIYHSYIFPDTRKGIEVVPEFKVMTYNVLYSNFDYDAVAGVVLSHGPDLVALQEVQPELMAALQARLSVEYPYSMMGWVDDYGTTAIFSRHPLNETYTLDLEAGRPAVVVRMKIGDREITFMDVHLLAYNLWRTPWKDIPADVNERTAIQNRQVEIVLREAQSAGGDVIVGCDCNSYETSSSYRLFSGSLHDSARGMGWFPGGRDLPGTKWDIPFQHIDHIWYSGSLDPIWIVRLRENGGSDHFPVLAAFHLDR